MFYLIYKTTNLVNQKIYIGLHKTTNLSDGYLGSGKLLIKAIKKHGKENFKSEIIESLNSEEEMVQREQEIVTEQFCDLENVYNIMPGGKFGSKDKNGLTFKDRKHSDETKAKISKNRRGLTVSVETKQKLKENNFARRNPTAQREHAQKAGQSARNIDDQKRKEINKKISITLKSLNSNKVHSNKGLIRQKVQCPYCYKQGALNTMKRFHFDNCKFQNAPIAQLVE